MTRGWWRTTCLVVSLSTLGSTAFAQTEPSVQPLGANGAPAQAPPPAYPPTYYPPPQPYGAYPRGPARLRYEEGDPIPAGYHVVHRARQGLVIAGTIVQFLLAAFFTLLVAEYLLLSDDRPGVDRRSGRR